MKALIAIFAIWVLGSIVTFATVGTEYIILYALVTMALFALAVWLVKACSGGVFQACYRLFRIK